MRTEEQEWEDLEKRIGADTIDYRSEVTASMRWWFREKFGFCADDSSVLKKWNEREAE